jgi:hypothetical protein
MIFYPYNTGRSDRALILSAIQYNYKQLAPVGLCNTRRAVLMLPKHAHNREETKLVMSTNLYEKRDSAYTQAPCTLNDDR